MKIEDVRPSFTVYVIASQADHLNGVAESLGAAGYMVATFTELTAAFSEIFSNPPHFILFDAQENKFELDKAIRQVNAQLPESHIFLLTPLKDREKIAPYLEQGVYDLILTPFASKVEVVRAIDRATERDYFMYLNERLKEEAAQAREAPPEITAAQPSSDVDGGFIMEFMRDLFAQTSQDDCLRTFLRKVGDRLGHVPGVFFRYVVNRRVLMASESSGVDTVNLTNLGIDLNDSVPGFRTLQLRDPLGIVPFVAMVKEVFQVEDFVAFPVEAMSEIQGVICFLFNQPSPDTSHLLQEWLKLLEKALTLLESEKRLHVVSSKDYHTDILNRATFITKVSEEISRARRTQMPVSMISIAADQFGLLSSQFGLDEAQLVLRSTARIIEKHSRINDIIGRTGVDEFGLLLPHTHCKGAMLKAERLRRIIETADFSKVLRQFPQLTLSLGVSEYPSLARDAEELMHSADEALFQVRKVGNKSCVYTAPSGFEPDFRVVEKGS